MFRSNKHITAQVIDDISGRTLAAASTTEADLRSGATGNRDAATNVGRLVAEKGRSLTARDVSEVTGLPVVATVEVSARVARTIDAGLLPSRITRLHELAQLDTLVTTPTSSFRPHPEAR